MRSLIWYDLRYLRGLLPVGAFCGGLMAGPLFIAALLYGQPNPWGWWLLVPGVAALVGAGWLLLCGIRERAVLKAQQAAGLTFPEEPLIEVVRRILYTNEDWLILAGKLAVHRSFVERMTMEAAGKGRGRTYYILFSLQNGRRYRVHADSASTARRIKAWAAGAFPKD